MIHVGEKDLSGDDNSVSGGEGTATLTYDGSSNPVLTLNNYTYSGTGHSNAAIRYDGSLPLTIVPVGNNSVTHAADSGDASAGILQAQGHWFEPSIAHQSKMAGQPRYLVGLLCFGAATT
ncbi:MAG: hypothetical protein Q4A01_11110 [Coriobacteriales bacterium]|nr:hypothetical protein [Coriobacteriales bacterium]